MYNASLLSETVIHLFCTFMYQYISKTCRVSAQSQTMHCRLPLFYYVVKPINNIPKIVRKYAFWHRKSVMEAMKPGSCIKGQNMRKVCSGKSSWAGLYHTRC